METDAFMDAVTEFQPMPDQPDPAYVARQRMLAKLIAQQQGQN